MGKKKGKGKKEQASNEDGAELNPTMMALMFQSQNEALQRQLAERTEVASSALAAKKELQGRVLELKHDFEDEQDQTYQITADMTRQYKSMQEELLNRINMLENTIAELKDQLQIAKIKQEETMKEKDRIVAEKEAEIAETKQRMEEMAHSFGDMLKETLDKMSERIEITSTTWEGEGQVSVQRKLADYDIAGSGA